MKTTEDLPVYLKSSPPSPVDEFFEKHGATIIKALFDGFDIPIYGEASGYPVEDHKYVLSMIISEKKELLYEFADEIFGKKDEKYYKYYYGADGDIVNIENEYGVEIASDWEEAATSIWLWEAVHYGFVSKNWLKAADVLDINLHDKSVIDKIEKGYDFIKSILE